jgi:DNA-binding protein HU-beta
MTKSELVASVAERAGVDGQTAEKVVGALFDTLAGAAKAEDKVAWPGFGTFTGATKPARTGRNPATGATIQIPASRVCKFSAAAGLKTALNS